MQVSRPQCGMRMNGWTGWTYLPKTSHLHSGITERTFRPVYVWMDGTNISDGTTTIAPLELIYLLCSIVLSQNINRTIHIYFNIEYLRFNTNLIEILLSSQKGLSNQGVEVEPEKRENKSNIFVTVFLISSVRSSSVYHGLLHTCSSKDTLFRFFRFFRI